MDQTSRSSTTTAYSRLKADDAVMVVIAREVHGAQMNLNGLMRRVSKAMEEHCFKLATAKTEMVLLTRNRIETIIPIIVNDIKVEPKDAVKYLGITLGTKLSCFNHINRVADWAAKVTAVRSRLMANTSAPELSK